MTEPNIIKPTVGRKVWYRPQESDLTGPVPMAFAAGQPMDATIIAVWGDDTVNVLVTDAVGRQFPVCSVLLVQDGGKKPTAGRYVEWMPYQQGQARKAAEPEATPPAAPDLDAMVGRFLAWSLPDDFYPDGSVSFDRGRASMHGCWPTGTNLLNAIQAREMLEHVLGGSASATPTVEVSTIPWVVIDYSPSSLPDQPGTYLVTVDTDEGRQVHTLEFDSKGRWVHEGEHTFQHGYYFRPIAWAPLPPAYAGAVGEED